MNLKSTNKAGEENARMLGEGENVHEKMGAW